MYCSFIKKQAFTSQVFPNGCLNRSDIFTFKVFYCSILVGGYILYLKVEEALKPYKELIEKKDTVKDNVNNGIDNIKGLFNKKQDE